MNALTLQIRLLQPLLVTRLGAGEENSSQAFDYIPGSVLRGALVGRYRHAFPNLDLARDPASRDLFFNGRCSYLNAYPQHPSGHRMLPLPLSWRIPKDQRDQKVAALFDFGVQPNLNLERPQLPGGSFAWLDGQSAETLEPLRHSQVHNASDTRLKKQAGKSFVYRYEALAAGQVFLAAVISDDQAALETLRDLCQGQDLKLGGARSANYGLVKIEAAEVIAGWQESPAGQPGAGEVVITLLSDAILRSPGGQMVAALDEWLGGLPPVRVYRRTGVVGGFNRKWGLPLPQAPVVLAGSVFVYPTAGLDQSVLANLQQWGVGERRLDGFGRLAVNWQAAPQLTCRRLPAVIEREPVPTVMPALAPASQALAQRMVNRNLEAVLEEQLAGAVAQLEIANPPQNAQLSRLRQVVRLAQSKGDQSIILKHIRALKSASEQLERARIDGQRLAYWLEEGLDDRNLIWEKHLAPATLPTLAGQTPEITGRVKLAWTARLLDALFKKAAKRSQAKAAEGRPA